MNSIDMIKATFKGETIDRVGIIEFYRGETINEWRTQGMDSDDPKYYFNHDIVYFFFDPRFGFQEKSLVKIKIIK